MGPRTKQNASLCGPRTKQNASLDTLESRLPDSTGSDHILLQNLYPLVYSSWKNVPSLEKVVGEFRKIFHRLRRLNIFLPCVPHPPDPNLDHPPLLVLFFLRTGDDKKKKGRQNALNTVITKLKPMQTVRWLGWELTLTLSTFRFQWLGVKHKCPVSEWFPLLLLCPLTKTDKRCFSNGTQSLWGQALQGAN